MGGSRMGGSRMGGSRMGGSRMGGSRMGGSKMGGSRIETIEGSRMVGVGGSRIGGSIVPTQGSMVLRTQQEFGALQPSILGNPSKTIVNEDEISIEGERFVEKKTLKNDGNQTYLTHSRAIGPAIYEVTATMQNGVFVQFDVNTNLKSEKDIFDMENMWVEFWPGEEKNMVGGSMMPIAAPEIAGSRIAGSRMAGSKMAGSRMAGSRIAGSRTEGSRMAGSRVENAGGSRMAASNALPMNLPGQ